MKYKLENLTKRNEEVTELLEEYAKADKQSKADFNIESKLANSDALIQEIEIGKLRKNPNNHFHKIDGEQWDNFVGSIKSVGIVTPCIVRQIDEDDIYEIIAGHNRVEAAKEIGIETIPCRVIECDDVEASILVGITNNQRENTTELEWGWTYRTTYEALKKDVGRPKEKDGEKLSHAGTVLRTDEILAKRYGVGRNTINRKMRLTYLIEPLYCLYESKRIPQNIVIDLSYLNEVNQANVAQAVIVNNAEITEEKARLLKSKAEEGMTIDEVFKICGEAPEKPAKVRPKKYQIDDALFPKEVKKGERENYIVAALRYIIDNEISLVNEER